MLVTSAIVGFLVGLAQAASIPEAMPVNFTCAEGSSGVLLESTLHLGHRMNFWSCPAPAPNQLNGTAASKLDVDPVMAAVTPRAPENSLTKRANLCHAPCTTYCFTPRGGGPNNFDCQGLGDGIMKQGGDVSVDPGFALTVTYRSCVLDQTNFLNEPITYCKVDLGAVVRYIGNHCQAKQNAHGGYCLFHNNWSTSSTQVSHS